MPYSQMYYETNKHRTEWRDHYNEYEHEYDAQKMHTNDTIPLCSSSCAFSL